MTLAAFGVIASLSATLWGVHSDNPVLMVLGFIAFACALGCVDYASDRRNLAASESLNALDRFRLGYEDEDRVA
jgi:hypothetical protein